MRDGTGTWKITTLACETALGRDWPTTWDAMIEGQFAPMVHYSGLGVMSPTDVIPVRQWRVADTADVGVFRRVYHQLLGRIAKPDLGALYLATNHADADTALASMEDRPRSSVTTRLAGDTERAPLLVQSACSSGMTALVAAALAARRTGAPTTVVAVDTVADIEIIGFRVAGALSPGRAAPFSGASDGLTIGEAAAAIRVEWQTENAANAPPALLGFGMTCDGYHPTDPDPSGSQLERAWRGAICMAGLALSDIDVVFLHGTGTKANDSVETEVCGRLWGSEMPAICSLKGMLGHTMGCSGLLNLIAAQASIEHGLLPPTLQDKQRRNNLLPIAEGTARRLDGARYALCVSSGFGGQNLAAIIGVSNER